MLGIESRTCKIAMSYEITDFKNTVMKSYLRNETGKNAKNVTNEKNIDHENEISINANSEKISQTNMNFEEIFQFFFPNSSSARSCNRSRKLSMKYKNDETDISIFFQNDFQND